MNRLVSRLLIGLLVAAILATGIGGLWWWKVNELKKNLVHNLETALGAKVEVTSLDFNLWHREIRATGISLVNQRTGAPWEKGGISQATIQFRLRRIFDSTLPLKIEVSSWNVVLRPHASESAEISPSSISTTEPSSPVPVSSSGKIKVMSLTAREGEVELDLSNNRKVAFHDVSFTSTNNGADVWTTHLKTGSIVSGALETGSGSVDLNGDRDKVTFSDLHVQCATGIITGDGEVSLGGQRAVHFALKATEIPVTMLVGLQWQMKLSGLTTGNLVYDGDNQTGTAHGQLSVGAGKFNILPWLGKVTALVGLPDISNVELDKATTDYEWKDGTLHLTNLDIRKNDVLRFAGEMTIDPQGQVDGRLKLGLPSSVTAKWPKLQEKVFSVPLEDYNWADVHLTGTPDHLQEDLTPRLLAVGAEEGGGLINQGTQKALDLLKGFLGN